MFDSQLPLVSLQDVAHEASPNERGYLYEERSLAKHIFHKEVFDEDDYRDSDCECSQGFGQLE